MSNNNGFENFSTQIIDMLVDTTLKKHGTKLDPEKLDSQDKERIRNLVESLKQSVDDLTRVRKEEENQEKEKG
ncbi:hypothetical protein F3157_19515 [Virgibacillus dakarensis]|uniref:hypothetical protein n=1 Tax=Virgibacillus dakarensis TaxID=1917889 RepID=UPI000B440B70|nr:hypothetical protein [Virgibacillus dakarensis]MBT2217929.1 hypothetical protein [Virgibacillus dakarensis]MTW87809.1 hypothetical protein [Virgibacillus dakarensis]